MPYEVLHLERKEDIAVITFNRPHILNALDPTLVDDIHAALDELADDADVRVIILTGAGRGFCSGADLSPRDGREARPRRSVVELGWHIRQMPQPVIAAVNGVAVGAGLGIAIAADIRVASEEARFSSIFIKRSFIPDTCTSYLLPQLVGPGVAAEMALTGRIYDAQWAYHVGLVNKLVPPHKLLEEAEALAREIAANPPLALYATKRLLYREENLEKVLERESDGNARLTQTEDHREAISAFLEKRTPVFKGK